MKPFMIFEGQPTTRPVPRNWTVKPLGSWGGRQAAVAYDPRRHDMALLPDGADVDTALTRDMRHCGWEPHATGHVTWQTRVNRRIIHQGTWRECADEALDAVAYAHDRESLSGSTRTEGAHALLAFGAQATEDEPVSARAYGLRVSVRPAGARTLWVRDRVEIASATGFEALDRVSGRHLAVHRDPPGPCL